MPARDHLHEHVRKALLSDGWTITHDPLLLANGRLKRLVLNPETEVIQRWTPEPPTVK